MKHTEILILCVFHLWIGAWRSLVVTTDTQRMSIGQFSRDYRHTENEYVSVFHLCIGALHSMDSCLAQFSHEYRDTENDYVCVFHLWIGAHTQNEYLCVQTADNCARHETISETQRE